MAWRTGAIRLGAAVGDRERRQHKPRLLPSRRPRPCLAVRTARSTSSWSGNTAAAPRFWPLLPGGGPILVVMGHGSSLDPVSSSPSVLLPARGGYYRASDLLLAPHGSSQEIDVVIVRPDRPRKTGAYAGKHGVKQGQRLVRVLCDVCRRRHVVVDSRVDAGCATEHVVQPRMRHVEAETPQLLYPSTRGRAGRCAARAAARLQLAGSPGDRHPGPAQGMRPAG